MQSPNLQDANSPHPQPLPPGARWALLLLLAINLLNFIDRYVLAGVGPSVQEEFRVSDSQFGWLATAFLLSYMLAAPLFGWLADHFSRWLLVGLGVVAWSLASGASGLAAGFTAMLLTRLFVGIGEASYGPTAPTILSELYPLERRGVALTCFYIAIPVGSALGFLLAGAVVRNLGLSWRWAFYLVVPPGILLGLAAMAMRRFEGTRAERSKLRKEEQAKSPGRTRLTDYQTLLRTPSYLLTTAGMTAMTFALGGLAFWIPKYIVWRHAAAGLVNLADPTAVDQAVANANLIFGPVLVVSGLLGTLAGGWAGEKLRGRFPGAYLLVSGAAAVLAFQIFLGLLVTPFPAAWGLIFVGCVALFFNTGPANTVLANVVHPGVRAAGFAVNIFFIHALGDAISPPLIGRVSDLWGSGGSSIWSGNMNAGFFAISLSILISGLFWLWGARHLEQDTALAPSRLDESKR